MAAPGAEAALVEAASTPGPLASAARRRVPTVLQMEGVECGAASLGMVLGYFGRFEPLEALRLACGVSRDGSKANNILKAARSLGLLAKGYKKEADDLHTLTMQQILFWNFNHFVVLEGIGKSRVWLNDPGEGQRTVTHQELRDSYTGVTLAFERGERFAKKRRRSPWLGLAERLPGISGGLLFLVLATLGLVLPGMLVPAFSRTFFDTVLVHAQPAWVRPLLLSMVATGAFWALLTWLQQTALLQLEGRLSLSGSSRFFWHVLRLPIQFFSQRYAGDIASRMEINYRIATLLCSSLATNAVNIIVVFFFGALLFRYDSHIAATCVLLTSLNLVVMRAVQGRQKDVARRLQLAHSKLMGVSMGGLAMIETYKASGSENDFFQNWAGHHAQALNAMQSTGRIELMLMEVPALLASLSAAAILWVGGSRVIAGVLTVGMLIAIQTLLELFQAPIGGLVSLAGRMRTVQADIERIDDVYRYPAQIPAAVAEAPVQAKLAGWLELRDVTFGYSRLDPPLVENFSLRVAPGQRVALVGGSGSGKSTIARLVCGTYEPWTGELLFDGRAREEIGQAVLSRSLACVDQDVVLFEGSVRDNLTLWDDTVPEDVMTAAARDAVLYEDILRLPGGFDSTLQEGGRNLSGGQRQRMEIARALVAEPRVLVLDEATSALDPVVEKQIEDALRRRACTCLVVAHRLSAIRDCDEIIVLERGRVVERGTHNELVAQAGSYARLVAEI